MIERSGNTIVRQLVLVPRRAATTLVRGYQYFLSPFFGQHCRFHPTCSNYAVEAVQRFGVLRGGWLTLCRLVRCQPWCEGGIDPVPMPRAVTTAPCDHDVDPRRC
jgi:putative membrane protein insertion efficiency factor